MTNQSQRNICFFNTSINYGGGEKWHIEIANHLSSNHNIFFYSHTNATFTDKITTQKVDLSRIKISNTSFLNPFKILSLSKRLKVQKIDTIIINLPSDLKVAGPAAKIAGVKNIIYRRGSAIAVKKTILNNCLFKNIITKILANSKETAKTISANFPYLITHNKIKVIYNGIDLIKYDSQVGTSSKKNLGDTIIIGNAGRLVKQKNQEDLLYIAKELASKGINFKIRIAGDGVLKDYLLSKAKELEIEEFIEYVGHVDNIKSFMDGIDIFALTSHWEGFGYVLAEAMASSKPIIGYDISSNPELIINEFNGYLVKLNDKEEFSAKLQYLLANKPERETLGMNGRKLVEEKFSFHKNIHELEEFIR